MAAIETAYVTLDIVIAGKGCEQEAKVEYIYTPFRAGYHEKGGGQIDPDEQENAEIQRVLVAGGTKDLKGQNLKYDIYHLLTDDQVDAIVSDILEQRN